MPRIGLGQALLRFWSTDHSLTALHPLAHALAMLEALTGQSYPTVLIGGLVSLAVDAPAGRRHDDQRP